MRRKCFAVFIAAAGWIFILDYFNLGLLPGEGAYGSLGEGNHYVSAIVEEVRYTEAKVSYKLKLGEIDGRRVSLPGYVLAEKYGVPENPYEYLCGTICFEGSFSLPAGQRNPGCFDYGKYLKSRRIFLLCHIDGTVTYEQGSGILSGTKCFIMEKRREFEQSLNPRSKGLIMGVLFGDTSFMEDEVYREFQMNGTCHVLAVSGLHMGIIYAFYRRLTGDREKPVYTAVLAAVLLVYGTLSLWSPSVIRAAVMIAMKLAAKKLDLRYDMLTAMSAVGLIVMAMNPYAVFGTSFQMSFLAVASMSFIMPILPAEIPEIFKASLGVNLGLVLYQIYCFNYVSLSFPLANLAVVTMAQYFVPAAIGYFVIFTAVGPVGLAAWMIDAGVFLMTAANRLTAVDGLLSFQLPGPPLWAAAGGTVLLFYLSSEYRLIQKLRGSREKIVKDILLIICFTLAWGVGGYNPISRDDIVFPDVGQGDCVHIRCGATDVLIDGGGSISYNVGEKTLKPYLLKNGAWDLDLALITHSDIDHSGGILELERSFKVKNLITRSAAGDLAILGRNIWIETIWPAEAEAGEYGGNENCSVFMIYYEGYKILVTGDIDKAAEQKILKYYKGQKDLSCDILKVAHHGSRTSTSAEFLEAVSPEYAVIQVGKNNYGHPAPETLTELEDRGITVFRNDKNGAVGFKLDKRGIKPHVMIN